MLPAPLRYPPNRPAETTRRGLALYDRLSFARSAPEMRKTQEIKTPRATWASSARSGVLGPGSSFRGRRKPSFQVLSGCRVSPNRPNRFGNTPITRRASSSRSKHRTPSSAYRTMKQRPFIRGFTSSANHLSRKVLRWPLPAPRRKSSGCRGLSPSLLRCSSTLAIALQAHRAPTDPAESHTNSPESLVRKLPPAPYDEPTSSIPSAALSSTAPLPAAVSSRLCSGRCPGHLSLQQFHNPAPLFPPWGPLGRVPPLPRVPRSY